MTDRDTCLRWLGRLGVAILLSAAFFTAFPGIDLVVAQEFGNAHAGFPVTHLSGFRAIRSLMMLLTDGLMTAALAALVTGFVLPTLRIIRPRIWVFCLTCYALGPGLIVNGVLKSLSERARPRDLFEFGGHALYARPFELSGQCAGNCSFVSGEASALATVATILILVVVPRLPERRRGLARASIVAIAAFGALLRIPFGAHFPSDVIFATLGMAALVTSLYLAFGLHGLTTSATVTTRPPRPGLSPVRRGVAPMRHETPDAL